MNRHFPALALLVAILGAAVAAQTAQQPQNLLYPEQPPGRLIATLVKGQWATAALMQEKAQQPRTRAYARAVARDEARVWQRLSRAAPGNDLREVPELKQEWQIFRSILRNQSGATADRDYLRGEIEVASLAAAALPGLGSTHPSLLPVISTLLRLGRRQVMLARQAQASFAGANSLGETSRGSIWNRAPELPGLQYIFPARLAPPPSASPPPARLASSRRPHR